MPTLPFRLLRCPRSRTFLLFSTPSYSLTGSLVMKLVVAALFACVATLVSQNFVRADDAVEVRKDVAYVERDGSKLAGDFYLPKGVAKAPVLIALHGGGWAHRSRATYQYWGPYLA